MKSYIVVNNESSDYGLVFQGLRVNQIVALKDTTRMSGRTNFTLPLADVRVIKDNDNELICFILDNGIDDEIHVMVSKYLIAKYKGVC